MKKFWEMSAEEYADLIGDSLDARGGPFARHKAKRQHAQLMMQRALDGGEIPAERLQEYPELDFGRMAKLAAAAATKIAEDRKNRKLGQQAKANARKKEEAVKIARQEELEAERKRPFTQTFAQFVASKKFSLSWKIKVLGSTYVGYGRRKHISPVSGGCASLEVIGHSEVRKHYELVRKALAEGRPVAPEVLADYPDLQGKQ